MQEKRNDEQTDFTVMYRLPGLHTFHTLGSEAQAIGEAAEMADHSGFVFAPFATNDSLPILIFKGQRSTHELPYVKVATHNDGGTTDRLIHEAQGKTEEKGDYAKAFAALHGMVASGVLRKVVLSRKSETNVRITDHRDIFLRACTLHPNAFVAMVRTPQNGTWLCATPELLVEVNGATGRTMALAGTRPASGKGPATWDEKNRAEQRVVAQYVRERIKRLVTKVEEAEPETAKAGNVCHLRTTFSFTLKSGVGIGRLADTLHPTPAVCGMPLTESQNAILANEGYDREYFSGYCGPVNIDGESHLFVTLRCMKIEDETTTLYAGGGLMPGSNINDEWDETEAKMETMRELIHLEVEQR